MIKCCKPPDWALAWYRLLDIDYLPNIDYATNYGRLGYLTQVNHATNYEGDNRADYFTTN